MVARSEGLKTPALPKTHLHTHCLGFLVPGPYTPSVCPQISNKPHGTQVFVLGGVPCPPRDPSWHIQI